MLIRFNVKNFLSFSTKEDGKSEEFSMLAGKVRNKMDHVYDDGKIKLLKFAALFGANASGKSNLVKAIDYMQTVIVSGIPNGFTELYCKVDPSNKEKESYFETEISINGKYYSYGFEIVLNKGMITSEWLVEISEKNEKMIFERNIKAGVFEFGNRFKNKKVLNTLNIYANDIKFDSSVLFLSIMNMNKRDFYIENIEAIVLKEIYDWFKKSLVLNYPKFALSSYKNLSKTSNVEEICELISSFGTGITSYVMIEVEYEKMISELSRDEASIIEEEINNAMSEIRRNQSEEDYQFMMRGNENYFFIHFNKEKGLTCKAIKFKHGDTDVLFNLYEESEGTIRLLDLLEVLLSDKKTFFIDELDRCLHPCLSYEFIQNYLQLAKEKNIQLIVTTHESRLMDFDLLRRDEIWFINKRYPGYSDIYSLEEYNSRFDQKIDKAYLDGRYGGVPVFNTIFPSGRNDLHARK